MKPTLLIQIILMTCSVHSNHYDENRDEALNDYFLEIIEGFRMTMPIGLEELNIPVLEPAFIEQRTWNYFGDATKFAIKLDNVTVIGLSDFEVDHLDIRIRTLEANVKFTFPELKSEGKYHLKGVAYRILPLKGNGPWWLHMNDFSITLRFRGEILEDRKFRLRMLSVIGDVSEVKMHFSNLLDSGHNLSQVVNGILRTNGRQILTALTRRLRDALEEAITPYVDLVDSSIILEFAGQNSTYTSV